MEVPGQLTFLKEAFGLLVYVYFPASPFFYPQPIVAAVLINVLFAEAGARGIGVENVLVVEKPLPYRKVTAVILFFAAATAVTADVAATKRAFIHYLPNLTAQNLSS